MLEKNGSIVLSESEVRAIRSGFLPIGLGEHLNLTLEELKVIVEASLYQPYETQDKGTPE